jgi:hypothetical protein
MMVARSFPVKLVGRVSRPASVSYLIHLQSIGMVAAKPAIVANDDYAVAI